MLVIFAFLGSPRSVLIPVIAIPLSLVGTLAIMLALGFSINLLTLLALVLAIGLVVDDAIIVVENVNRHLGGRHGAARRRHAGGARARHADPRDDRGAARGVHSDRLSGRSHRRSVHRVRLHARRRRDRFGGDRVDALADDVLEALEAASRRSRRLGRPRRQVHRRALRALARLVSAPPRAQLALTRP